MIYFDNSATSPIDEEVMEAMLPYLKEEYGNPSSKYYCIAENARNAVEESRAKVARLLGALPEQIVFTAGSTESTNFIIKGYMDYRRYYGDGRNHIITSVAEHKATLHTCRYLNGEIYSNNDPTVTLFGDRPKVDRGYQASFVGITPAGDVPVELVADAMRSNSAMVSVIYVNNETGAITDVKAIAEECAKRGIAIHSDLTQAVGKMSINVKELGIDYASCSAHKIYGPKGVGAAYLKGDDYGIQPITAFMHGGEQEFGFRAGTLAVHNIVGFGRAAEIALRDMGKNEKHIKKLDKMLVSELAAIPYIRLTVESGSRLPGIISIVIEKENFNNERFLKEISDCIALSSGSACSAGKPSYVISALGLKDQMSKVLRISLNKYTVTQDIERLVEVLKVKI